MKDKFLRIPLFRMLIEETTQSVIEARRKTKNAFNLFYETDISITDRTAATAYCALLELSKEELL